MRISNITDKNIRDFDDKDTVYIRKTVAGYSNIYLCKFISYGRGIVKGEIIEAETNPRLHKHETGKEITAKVTNCCLWGNTEGDALAHPHCHWFHKSGTIAPPQ